MPVRPFDRHCNSREWRIIDLNATHFSGRDQPEFPGFAAFQHRRKQFYQRFAPNRRAHVVPGTVAGDTHIDVAAHLRPARRTGRNPAFALALRQGAFKVNK